MTIRLERGQYPGQLYNFKGVNHLIVMAVKVLVPKRLNAVARSSLNPNYDHDFVRYTLSHIMRDTGREPLTPEEIEAAMQRHEFLAARGEPPPAFADPVRERFVSGSESASDSDSDPESESDPDWSIEPRNVLGRPQERWSSK